MKTDRDRPTLTATDLSKRRWLLDVRCSFAVVASFAVFSLFSFAVRPLSFAVRGSRFVVCRVPFAICRLPHAVPCAVCRSPFARSLPLSPFSHVFTFFSFFRCFLLPFVVRRSPFAVRSWLVDSARRW